MKTALVKVTGDLHGTKSSGHFSFLISLGLSAAADRAGDTLLCEALSLLPRCPPADLLPSQCLLLLHLLCCFQDSVLGPLLYLYPLMSSSLMALNAMSVLTTLQFMSPV